MSLGESIADRTAHKNFQPVNGANQITVLKGAQ